MKWNKISEVGNPKESNYYFVTVWDKYNPSFPDMVIAYFYNGEWYDEYINDEIPNVVSWHDRPEADEVGNG